jgi:hypothetical protein
LNEHPQRAEPWFAARFASGGSARVGGARAPAGAFHLIIALRSFSAVLMKGPSSSGERISWFSGSCFILFEIRRFYENQKRL